MLQAVPSPQGSDHDKVVSDFEYRRQRFHRSQRVRLLVWMMVATALFIWSLSVSEFFANDKGADPFARIASFLNKMNPELRLESFLDDAQTDGSFRSWFYGWRIWIPALWTTLETAILSTMIGAFAAVPVSFLTSRNLMPFRVVRETVRRLLEALRTVPDLIIALIFVAAFGIGPLAGVITLSLSTLGRLGKLFAELNENADMRMVEAVKASGGNWWKRLRFGLIPQVLPGYASYGMLKFEGNIGGAAALGIVGAGGIGIELVRAITYTQFADYLAILLLITLLIFAVDLLSEAIRHRLIHVKGGYV